jgi:hypothetical protein
MMSSPEPGISVPEGVTRWRRRPVVVEMLEWTGENAEAMRQFCGRGAEGWRFEPPAGAGRAAVWNDQEHAWIPLGIGHRVVRGALGEVYPVSPEAVAATYEPADGPVVAATPSGEVGPGADTSRALAGADDEARRDPAPSSSGEAIVHAALERAVERMRIAEGEVLMLRTELASTQNAIGTVLRKSYSVRLEEDGPDAVAVGWLLDALGPWTGRERSEEESRER